MYSVGVGSAVYSSPFSTALHLHTCKMDVVFYLSDFSHACACLVVKLSCIGCLASWPLVHG